MPDVSAGLTFAADERSRAPEAPLDAETEQHVAIIREQSDRARTTPSDDGFNKADISAALLAPTGWQAGVRTSDQDAADALAAKLEADYGPDSAPGQALAEEQRLIELGRQHERLVNVVNPAFETLNNSFEAQERAAAVAYLNPTERQAAIDQGLLDADELEELVAIAAEVLDQRQRIAAGMSAALAEQQAGEGRGEEYDAIRSDFGITDDAEAAALLSETDRRLSQAGLAPLAMLPPQAWGASVRAVAGQLLAEDAAEAQRVMKQGIVDADSSDISSGLTEAGRPVVPRMIVQPKIDYSKVPLAASGRVKALTDDEFREQIMTASDDSRIENGVREGGEQIPASTRAKMAQLFGR